jgi:hypothetical protein
MNWPCFHSWEKWSDPVNGIASTVGSDTGYFKVLQMRVCAKCGIADIRNLGKMRSIDSLRDEAWRSK